MPIRPRSGRHLACSATESRDRAPRRRLLERGHLAALRIDARHDVLDRAVLAGRIHRLEDEQQRPAVLRVQHVLLLGEPLHAARRSSAASPLSS